VITLVRFISLLLTSLLVGTLFGIWLGFSPAAASCSLPHLPCLPLTTGAAVTFWVLPPTGRSSVTRGGTGMFCAPLRESLLWLSRCSRRWSPHVASREQCSLSLRCLR